MNTHLEQVRYAMNTAFYPDEFVEGYMSHPYFGLIDLFPGYLVKPSLLMAMLRRAERRAQ